jgi:hypothetical protein
MPFSRSQYSSMVNKSAFMRDSFLVKENKKAGIERRHEPVDQNDRKSILKMLGRGALSRQV